MITENVKLERLKCLDKNPRYIRDDKFKKLIDSILIFPQMLELRPIVVDSTYTILGGNMRYQALIEISKMNHDIVFRKLNKMKAYTDKDKDQQFKIAEFWGNWFSTSGGNVKIIKADGLSEEQKKEFVIKDNVEFGQWDFDLLANEWDDFCLQDWGMDLPNSESDNQESENQSRRNIGDIELKHIHVVEVTCKDEAQQETLYNELLNKGYKCQVLIL